MTDHEKTARAFIKALWGKGLYTIKVQEHSTEVLSSKPVFCAIELDAILNLCAVNSCTYRISGQKLIVENKIPVYTMEVNDDDDTGVQSVNWEFNAAEGGSQLMCRHTFDWNRIIHYSKEVIKVNGA